MEHTEESGMTALIHPVSAMIISNHFTRCVLQSEGNYVQVCKHFMSRFKGNYSRLQVIGALLGTQSARMIEVKNCFEVKSELKDGKLEPDLEYFKERQTMCTFELFDAYAYYE